MYSITLHYPPTQLFITPPPPKKKVNKKNPTYPMY